MLTIAEPDAHFVLPSRIRALRFCDRLVLAVSVVITQTARLAVSVVLCAVRFHFSFPFKKSIIVWLWY